MSRSRSFRFLSAAALGATAAIQGLVGCASSPTGSPERLDAATSKLDAQDTVDAASQDAREAGEASTPTGPVLITEPDQAITPIYDFIMSATKTIDMTMYELTDTAATNLLIAAAKSGVAVRVILDQNLEKRSNTTAYNALSAGGVSVHWANTTYSATHQKTITVDGKTSAVMTLNLTSDYYATSRDFAVITSDPADVAAIESVFGDDFADAAVTPPLGDDLVWSPTNSESSMVGLINGAKVSLAIENEEMSDSDVVAAISAAATRGVHVEVIMTASKSWDANFTLLKSSGVNIVTYAEEAPLYIHAKIILADYGMTGASVFIGSENFSNASLTKNRELGLILNDSAILESMSTTLTSDFTGGTPY